MAVPRRCKVIIDGNEFQALAGSFKLHSQVSNDNLPQAGSTEASVWVYADMHDKQNLPQATISALFNLAKIPTAKSIRPIKIEYFQDDAEENVIATVKFKGWISSFETSNLTDSTLDDDFLEEQEREHYTTDVADLVNDLLTLKLTVSLNTDNASEFALGN